MTFPVNYRVGDGRVGVFGEIPGAADGHAQTATFDAARDSNLSRRTRGVPGVDQNRSRGCRERLAACAKVIRLEDVSTATWLSITASR